MIRRIGATPALFRDDAGALWMSLPAAAAFILTGSAIAGGLWEVVIQVVLWTAG